MADRAARAAVVRLRAAARPAGARARAADRGGVALHLRFGSPIATSTRASSRAARADARSAVLRTLLLLDLESHPPGRRIDIVTIEVDPAPGRIVQYSLLERPCRRRKPWPR